MVFLCIWHKYICIPTLKYSQSHPHICKYISVSVWILDCVGPDGKPKQVRTDSWHIHYAHTCVLAKRQQSVWTGFFLLISLVTHGPVVATSVCATRIPWASSVTLFSAHQSQLSTAVNLDSSWSTKQWTAAQHSPVVSWQTLHVNSLERW